MTALLDNISAALESVRGRTPLVHNITNYVVMNFTANALLSLGAAPVMAHAIEEVEEMAGLANALVLNIGTLSSPWIEAMMLAGRVARSRKIPIILDPVGAGATTFRTQTANRLLNELPANVLRGNASEILALAGRPAMTRGVDSQDSMETAREAAHDLATQRGIVVSLTGVVDYITDGRKAFEVRNGHALMARITGTGCAVSAVTGAFCAVEPNYVLASTAALAVFDVAGELAAQGNPLPGTFQMRLLDSLAAVGPTHIRSMACINAIN